MAEPRRAPPPSLHSAGVRAVLTVVAAALAWAGYQAHVPLFYGVDLVFGSIAALLALVVLGTVPALVVAAIGAAYTVPLWGHPYAWLTFTAEVLVVAVLYRRGLRNLVLADACYWLLLGVPLTLVSYRVALGMEWQSMLLVVLKQSLNGVFNALLASLLWLTLRLAASRRSVPSLGHPGLQELIFHPVVLLALLTSAIPVIHESRSLVRLKEEMLAERMREAGERWASARVRGRSGELGIDPEMRLTALDGEGSARPAGALQPWPLADGGSVQAASGGLDIALPGGRMSAMQRWAAGQYRLEVRTDGEAAPALRIEYPARALVGRMQTRFTELMLWLMALALVSMVAATLLTRAIARPLRQLQQGSRNAVERIAAGDALILPDSRIREFRQVSESFQAMGDELREVLSQLRRSHSAMEDQVARRTAELALANADLQVSGERLELATEVAAIGVWDYDPVNDGLHWNGQMHAITGLTSARFGGRYADWDALLHPDHRERSAQFVRQLREQAIAAHLLPGFPLRVDAQYRICRADDGAIRWIKGRAGVFLDERGAPVRMIGTCVDVTELVQAHEAAEAGTRAKSEFLSVVNHELRTPLIAISGALGLLAGGAGGELPEEALDLLRLAQDNGARLRRIIDDLLDIERLVSGKLPLNLVGVELSAALRQACATNATYGAARGVGIACRPLAGGVMVVADAQRLQQVLSNLLSNAVKHSPAHANVEVWWQAQEAAARVRVCVRDTGAGVPEAFRARIFQPFSQADASDRRALGGAGLGLAIAKELVERMGGRIGFDSREGEGATFWLELELEMAVAQETARA